MTHLVLQAAAGGDPAGALASLGHTLKVLLLATVAGLLGIFLLMYLATHLAGGIMNMWGGFPFAKKEHAMTGQDLHSRAHKSLMEVGVKVPIMLGLVVILATIVATATGFSMPLDFKEALTAVAK